MNVDLIDLLDRHGPAQAVVWDFDGVLSETESLHQASYAQVLTAHGVRLVGDWYTALIGNTAWQNWQTLIDKGLDTDPQDISLLEEEREAAFASLAAAGLKFSQVGVSLVPAFARAGVRQDIVSNGDLDLIGRAVRDWGISDMVTVVHRAPDGDKLALLEERAAPGVITFDDTDRYLLAAGRKGAFTVGVRHRHNSHGALPADIVLSITGERILAACA
ncbi:hypothetical protein OH768_11620 [Streptomyces sp. NBC_01622]|uniref:hypothetical protein n=1 Tax=Streptomyces sp. NBC_01622 TaxID=2975903 RepID=UPI00387095E3|nr:hypothetical protein OH768_11620 [Streptomyces sp. NBC_01622]